MSDKAMLTVVNPFDQSVLDEFPYDSPAEVDAKIARAQAAQQSWSQLPLDERIKQVKQAAAAFAQKRELVARDITLQMGKPLTQAQGEFDTFLSRVDQMLVDAPLALSPDLLPEQEGLTRSIVHEPIGVVFNIAAWNYPLLVSANALVPAILAGNTVLLKHSQRTPLTGQALADCFAGLGVPDIVIPLITSHDTTAKVIRDPRVGQVAFVGSVEGGRHIRRAAVDRFIDVGLELGGKDPAYVAADADLDFAAENIVDGACYNAGQSCCAIERIYVHHDVYNVFLERVQPLVEAYQWGDPLNANTTIGPLARAQGIDELEEQVTDAEKRGAKILVHGGRVADTAGNFFMPTLVVDAPQDSLIIQEESFGPLVPVCAVDSDEQAIERMNDSRFGLTASVWTADRGRAESMARRINAGTVFQNRADFVDPAQPWTGWGESGTGSTLSRYGFYGLTRRKSLHFRS